jgi:hypothetical protein
MVFLGGLLGGGLFGIDLPWDGHGNQRANHRRDQSILQGVILLTFLAPVRIDDELAASRLPSAQASAVEATSTPIRPKDELNIPRVKPIG